MLLSTFCCLQTQVYVLLRRCADGAPLEHCASDDEPQRWSSPADMVDPVAQQMAEGRVKGQPKPDEPADDAPAAGGDKTEG